jgi:hypothetical protein
MKNFVFHKMLLFTIGFREIKSGKMRRAENFESMGT